MAATSESTKKRSRPSDRSNNGPAKKQRMVDSSEKVSLSHRNTHLGSDSVTRTVTGPTTSTATHVRFGSEDPPAISPAIEPPTTVMEEDVEEEMDSDDEAPEDVSTTAAQHASKAASADIAQALRQQQLKDKRKRQEQAARANAQSEVSKKKSKAKNHADDLLAAEDESADEEAPELLPEDLLAQDFTRAPTPPPASKYPRDEALKRTRRIKLDTDPPKDIQIGPVKVSVLPKIDKLLPPKVSKRSRAVREGWLTGRKNMTGLGKERKQFQSGFLRR